MPADELTQPHDRFVHEHLDQVDVVDEHGNRERLDKYVARRREERFTWDKDDGASRVFRGITRRGNPMMKSTTTAALILVSAVNIAAAAPPACTAPSPCDGSVFLGPDYAPGTPVTLFSGVVPADGFMIGVYSAAIGNCTVNDDGPATSINGFKLQLTGHSADAETPGLLPFATPPGYKPLGPVSVQCTSNEVSVEARGW